MRSLFTVVLLATMLLATAYSMPYSDNNQADKQTLMKRVLNLLKEKQVEAEMDFGGADVQMDFDNQMDTDEDTEDGDEDGLMMDDKYEDVQMMEEDGIEEDGSVTAQISYQNKGDKPLEVICNQKKGMAINRIQSIYDKKRKDRRFRFSCTKVAATPPKHCQWYKDINEWDQPLVFTCPSDYYMTGIKSYHNNKREDRRWSIKCCRSDGYRTESCELTDYINNFRGTIDTESELSICKNDEEPAFFTGLYSYHDNSKEDRRWRIYQCKAGRINKQLQ